MTSVGSLLAAVPLLLAAQVGVADHHSQSFSVSTVVRPNCVLGTQALHFGEYVPGAGDLTAETVVSVRCSRASTYTVALNKGAHGTSVSNRKMSNGLQSIDYQLYLDAGRQTIWGDQAQESVVSGEGEGLTRARTAKVYGRLLDSPHNQQAAEGSYTDLITVTISF